ncbi:MAG TPA: hypothetical protein VKR21_13915 [Solirubrobacteraceae bacterium]|nr:hypothetical protein [Solirubrobacteraceae bacterium]
MAAETAVSAPADSAPRPARRGERLGAGDWRRLADSPLLLWGLACVAAAAVSAAVLPTVPSYDPWAWIVWGREVSDPHLSFAIGGGPSWKPLPVIFTAIFGLFGGAAPTLWVITARAGGLLGLAGAFQLARRLTGGGAWGVVAGVIAAAAIVLTQDWAYYMFRGTSEPMLIATSLWAIDRLLAGRHGSAFVLAVATSLMRPEAWPLLAVYAVWLWLRRPSLRVLVAAGVLAVPFFWFVPPWIGSGQPFLAAVHAHEYNGHLGSNRLLTVLGRGVDLQVLPALIVGLVAVGLSAMTLLRERGAHPRRLLASRDGLTVALAIFGLAWWAVVIAMTLDGYPGLERFYLPAAAAICVLGGIGVVRLARLCGRRAAWLGPAVAVGLLAASVPFTTLRISVARAQESIAARAVTRLDELSAAVAAVGGHHAVYPCHSSFAAVNHSVQTALAWKLHVTLGRVGTSMRHQGLMFVGPHDSIDGGAPRIDPRLTQPQPIAQAGVWRVYRMTSPGADTRCVGR